MLSLSPGPSVHVSPFVEATRSTPSDSDIANWPMRRPGTSPLAAYSVWPSPAVSKRWIAVSPDCWAGMTSESGPIRRPIELTTPSSGGAILSVAT